jgi:hypothetical protein
MCRVGLYGRQNAEETQNMSTKRNRSIPTNKNAHIINRTDRTGKIRTETVRRDVAEFDIAVSTNPSTGATRLYFDRYGREGNFGGHATFQLNGRQARTLFITLQKHFAETGVPAIF